METLHRTGQVDPAALLSLPDEVVRLHLAHTLNHMTGQYDPVLPSANEKDDTAKSKADTARRISEHHEARQHGPTSGDIAAAKRMLEVGGMNPVVQQAAIRTLQQAGRL